jgi:hypothetical protein
MDLDRVVQLLEDGLMPLFRTDFSSDDAWHRVVDEVTKESGLDDGDRYAPNIEPILDRGFESTTPEALAAVWPRESHGYVMLAEQRSVTEAAAGGDLTVVFVDLYADDEDEEEFGEVFGRAFRCEVGEVDSIEVNLSLANMDFSDFANAVDDDGEFGGF